VYHFLLLLLIGHFVVLVVVVGGGGVFERLCRSCLRILRLACCHVAGLCACLHSRSVHCRCGGALDTLAYTPADPQLTLLVLIAPSF